MRTSIIEREVNEYVWKRGCSYVLPWIDKPDRESSRIVKWSFFKEAIESIRSFIIRYRCLDESSITTYSASGWTQRLILEGIVHGVVV